MGKPQKSPRGPIGYLPADFGARPFTLRFRVPGSLGEPFPFEASAFPTLRIRAPRIVRARGARASRRAPVRTRRTRSAGRSATVRSSPAVPSGSKDGPPPPRSTNGDRSRAPRARTALPSGLVSPIVVSDATSLALLGLTGRQFRSFVRAHNVPYAKCGRRTLARLDLVLDAIDRLSGVNANRPAAAPVWNEDGACQRV
jgi:hypothetical protein